MITEKFKVFDPYTGSYTDYNSEIEARAALLATAQKILDQNEFSFIHSVINENEEEKWSSIPVSSFVVVETA